MFGFKETQGMRLVSFFQDHVPEGCVGMVWSTLSGATRYYIFSSSGVPSYGFKVCEMNGKFVWMDGMTIYTEEEAMKRSGCAHADCSMENLILCTSTRPLWTQQISSTSKETAVTLSDGTFVPYAQIRYVKESQDQIPTLPNITSYLKRNMPIHRYNQFSSMNVSLDESVMNRIKRQLPKKSQSMLTNSYTSKNEAQEKIPNSQFIRAKTKDNIPL